MAEERKRGSTPPPRDRLKGEWDSFVGRGAVAWGPLSALRHRRPPRG